MEHLESNTRRRPLDLPPSSTLITFVAAWLMTLLSYFAINAILGGMIETGLTKGLSITDLPEAISIDGCEKRFHDQQDSETSVLACGLANWAAPEIFEDRIETGAPHKDELIGAISTGLRGTQLKWNASASVLFLQAVENISKSDNAILRLRIISPRGTKPEETALTKLRGMAKYSSILNLATGMVDVPGPETPSMLLLASSVVAPTPSQRRAHAEASILLDGLFDKLGNKVFWPRRLVQAINGGIQWLTLLMAWWCALLLLARWRLVLHNETFLQKSDTPVDSSSLLEFLRGEVGRRLHRGEGGRPREVMDEVIDGVADEIDTRHYNLIQWQIDSIPTLGFLGTIVGMILAMSGAGQIVGAENPQALKTAMGGVSISLGTAFDTTLVGLVLNVLVSRLFGFVRGKERDLLIIARELGPDELQKSRAAGA